MQSIYEEFDGMKIPAYNRNETLGSGQARSGMTAVIGGYVDHGGLRTHRTLQEISINGTIHAATAQAAWETLARWLALRGKKGQLYRKLPNNTRQWAIARLILVEAENSYEGYRSSIEIQLTFEVISTDWYGFQSKNWTLNAGYRLNEGLVLNQGKVYSLTPSSQTITLDYRGTAIEKNIILTITAGTKAIPDGLTINGDGISLKFNQIIAAGKNLLIDAGIKSIRNGGADAFGALQFLAGHSIGDWLQLVPGINILTISTTVPITVQVTFSERFV